MKFGLPVAAAVVMGLFIYIILKYILAGVVSQVGTITMLISALDNRVKTMNNEVVRIDLQMCHAFGVEPDLTVVARADGQKDARKD